LIKITQLKYEEEKIKFDKILEEIKNNKNLIINDNNTIGLKLKKLEETKDFLSTVDGKINQLKDSVETTQQEYKLNLKQSNETESLLITFKKK